MANKKIRKLIRYEKVQTITKPVKVEFVTKTGKIVSFKAIKVIKKKGK